MHRRRRLFRDALVFSLLAALGAFPANGYAAAVAAAAAVAPPAKVSFSESYRREKLTTRYGGGFSTTTETRSASEGKLNISLELPLDGIDVTAFDPATPFALRIGSFEFRSTLGSDSSYRPGMNQAKLTQTAASRSGNSRVILATAQLRWGSDRLSVKIEVKIPQGGKPVASEDFLDSSPGAIKAETKAQVQIAARTLDFTVPFQGQMKRKTAGGGDVFGEVVTVDLRGDTKIQAAAGK